MRKHAIGTNSMARDDVATKCLEAPHLHIGKIGIVEVVAGIMYLDADRAGIEIGLAVPETLPGVPGAESFWHHLRDAAFLVDQIMTGDLRLFARQPIER